MDLRKSNSREAHGEAVMNFTEGHRAKILSVLKASPETNYPCMHLASITGLDYHATARRMSELVNAGLVKVTGKVKINGRNCSTYKIKSK